MAFHKTCTHCHAVRIMALSGLGFLSLLGSLTYAYEINNGISNLEYGQNVVKYEGKTTGTATGSTSGTAGDWYGNKDTATDNTKDASKDTSGDSKPPKSVGSDEDASSKDSSTKKSTTRSTSHMTVSGVGVGDTCRVGDYEAKWYVLNRDFPARTQKGLEAVMKDVFYSDRRLRRVQIYDDQVDLYYLQPATFLGMPMNYLVHVRANSTSWKFTVDHSSLMNSATQHTAQVSQAFTELTSTYLTDEQLDYYDNASVTERDAKVLEVANQVMYQIPYKPYSNSFFVCYIMPYLLYIFLLVLIAFAFLFIVYRRMRKSVRNYVQHNTYHSIDDRDDYHTGGAYTASPTYTAHTSIPSNTSSPHTHTENKTVGISFGDRTVHVVGESEAHDVVPKKQDPNDGFTYSKSDFKGFK